MNPENEKNSSRNILLLLQGHFISKIGTALFDIAVVLWLKEKTGLAAIVGLVMMFSKLPEILLSPISGTIADMVSRKKILVLSDLLIGILVISLSLACYLAPHNMPLLFTLLIAGSVCTGIFDSFFNPAVASFIPELTPATKLQKTNSIYRFLTSAAGFIGQSIGGTLYILLGAPAVFLINGVSYLCSSLSEAGIKTSPPPPSIPHGMLNPFTVLHQKLKEGIRYIWKDRPLKEFLIILLAYHFFIAPFTVILPFYVSEVLHKPENWYGYLTATLGIGLLTGFILAGIKCKTGHTRSLLVFACFGLSALSFISLGIFPSLLPAFAAIYLIGASIGIIVVNLNTVIQLTTPNTFHGRIFGLYNTLSSASIPLGMGFFGILLDLLKKKLPALPNPEAVIFLSCGCVLFLLFLTFLKSPASRKVLSAEPQTSIRVP